MAASYQTGTATSPVDLVQLLATWLTAQGWTQDMSQADGAGWRLHMHKGSDYVNIKAAMNQAPYTGGAAGYGVACYLGTGFSSGSVWNAQAGGPKDATANTYTIGALIQLNSGALNAYYFFDDGADNVVVVVERSAGLFTHFEFGITLTKAGAWTGGQYVGGSIALSDLNSASTNKPGVTINALAPFHTDSNFALAYVRADVDTFLNKWVTLTSYTSTQYYTGKRAAGSLSESIVSSIPHYEYFGKYPVNALNSGLILLPIRIYAERDGGGYSLIGSLPQIFACYNNTSNGYSAGQIVSIGAENYMVFPNFLIKKLA